MLERAAAPAFKKTGKPAMERSVLQLERQDQAASRADDADAELHAWMARVLLGVGG